jgi:hypothetical protein
MEESYILVLLTILILLVVVVGYLAQKKVREIELETNALKCDFETHTDQVNQILSLHQMETTESGCDEELDMSKIQNIMNGNYDELSKQNEEIFKNMNNDELKCVDGTDDESDTESLIIDNSTALLEDTSDSDGEEQTLEKDMNKMSGGNHTQNNSNDEVELNLSDKSSNDPLKTTKKKRKVPNVGAGSYEEGHQIVSENDGKTYKVAQYKSGSKRWVLAK